MCVKSVFAVLGLMALGLGSMPAESGVLKCKDKNGAITYTQTACPPGTTNADFSAESNPNNTAPRTDASSAGSGPSTSRGLIYMDSAIACTQNERSDSCELLQDAIDYCKSQQNWTSESCVALREGMKAARDRVNMSDAYSRHRLRELCARGRELACVFDECPADVYIKGSDDQVRACAARADLPVSRTWIKLESQYSPVTGVGHRSTSKYVCLKKLERLNEIGEHISFRESVTVISFAPSGVHVKTEHTVSSLPDETFATADAAATAGCEAKTSSSKQKIPPPGQKKGLQGA